MNISPEVLEKLVAERVEAEVKKKRVNGTSTTAPMSVERYQPFPTDTLPAPLDSLVREASRAIGCDESFVALPLLSCCGASIGNTCRLVVKSGWNVPPAIWSIIVGESGTFKSPAFKVAKAPIQRHQKNQLDEYHSQRADYDKAIEDYDVLVKQHKNSKSKEPLPEKPKPPILSRTIVSDCTVESLAPILTDNPRGLLLQRDELNGWLGSFNAYKSAKGSDESAWLSMFDGESILVDRKLQGTAPIYCESALVSITGGIQPAVLASSMTKEHRSSGMASRFLLASPPRKAHSWTDDEIGKDTQLLIDGLFIKLLGIDFANPDGNQPHYIGLSQEAKQVFRDFFNEHHQEQADLTGDSAAAWSKLLGYVPRVALVFHCVKQVQAGRCITESVSEDTMREAIELVGWFKNEAARLYASIDDTDDQRDLRDLAAWIDRKHGGQCTPSDLVRGIKAITTVEQAEAQGKLLVKAGLAEWGLVETASGTGPQKRILRTT